MTRELSGVLNCNKPRGWTSFDVIRRLRRALGMKKMGHTGSLDPIATGVLVICLGRTTRLVELLMAAEKEYVAEVRFGAATDTYDTEGVVTSEGEPPADLAAALESVLPRYRGEIMQAPPPYSAAKFEGERLYKLARQGNPVQVPPRKIEVRTLELMSVDGPTVTLRIVCSKGTYVRALAHDLGRELGCGAHLSGLVRTRNGVLTVAGAITVDTDSVELRESVQRELVAPEDALAFLPRWDLPPDDFRRYLHGMPTPLAERLPVGSLMRTFGPAGFIGVGKVVPGPGGAALQPHINLENP